MLLSHEDYVNSLQRIFGDPSRFKKIKQDPTINRLTTVQKYRKTLSNRGEISESEMKAMRPKFAHFARVHGLPKTHKQYDHLPKFRPITETTNTPYYGISKFLSNHLNPLTENQYVVRDSSSAANKTREIPKELFDDGYRFVSYQFVSFYVSAFKQNNKHYLKPYIQ